MFPYLYKNNKLSFAVSLNKVEKIFLLALLFLPFDGFPLIPIDTLNRPLSILILLIYFLLSKIDNKFKFSKAELSILVIIVALWLQTIYQAISKYNSFIGFNKFIITSSFAFITISSCLDFYKRITERYTFEQLLELLSYILALSLILPMLLGIIQFLALRNLIPIEIVRNITSFFVQPVNFGEVGEGRIQMTTTEASHAGSFIVLVLIFIYFFSKFNPKVKRLLVFLLFLTLILISSSNSFIIFIATMFLYSIFTSSYIKVVRYAFFIALTGFLLYNIQDYLIPAYTANRIQSLVEIYNLGWDEFVRIGSIDFSIFDRMSSPILGFRAMQETNYFGTGGESYFYLYDFLVQKYFPEALSNSYVINLINDKIQVTPKFLIAKIAGELGIVAVAVFIYFLIHIFLKINYNKAKYDSNYYNGICACFFFSIASMTDCSYFHFPQILLLTLTWFSGSVVLTETNDFK